MSPEPMRKYLLSVIVIFLHDAFLPFVRLFSYHSINIHPAPGANLMLTNRNYGKPLDIFILCVWQETSINFSQSWLLRCFDSQKKKKLHDVVDDGITKILFFMIARINICPGKSIFHHCCQVLFGFMMLSKYSEFEHFLMFALFPSINK